MLVLPKIATKMFTTILRKARLLGMLAGVPLATLAAGAEDMVVPVSAPAVDRKADSAEADIRKDAKLQQLLDAKKLAEQKKREDALYARNSSLNQLTSAKYWENGFFLVGRSGKITVEFLGDYGGSVSEVGVFSLEGMEKFDPGSLAFRAEAVNRALSLSPKGYMIITDSREGARFGSHLEFEESYNQGAFLGVKTFELNPGSTFGVFIVPRGTACEFLMDPSQEAGKRPLFSISKANPVDPKTGLGATHLVDITGQGAVFGFEDTRLDGGIHSDRDYNDILFRLGAVRPHKVPTPNYLVNRNRDIRRSFLYPQLLTK